MKLPTTINNKYKYTEKTEVRRVFSDSTVVSYSRIIDYYFILRSPKGPEKGFQTFLVSIDSMDYTFKEGNSVVNYNSVLDDSPPYKEKDIKSFITPLGKNFDMTYSPYGDIASITGESVESFRDYVSQNGRGILDSLERLMWLDGLTDERLMQICDVKKINFPLYSVTFDSTWNTPYLLNVNGLNFRDTLTATLLSYKEGIYTINAASNNLTIIKKPALLYNIEKLINIDSCSGKGIVEISLNNHNTIKKTFSQFDIETVMKMNKETIKEYIHTEQTWDLQGQFY